MNIENNTRLIEKVSELYRWLDREIQNPKLVLSEANGSEIGNSCNACGNCCDFDSYGHRLYVTTPEVMYFAAKIENPKIENWNGRCPYQVDNKCSVHPYRFASCRIFFCRGNAQEQSRLSEETLKRLKAICIHFGIPYRYIDLKTALGAESAAVLGF